MYGVFVGCKSLTSIAQLLLTSKADTWEGPKGVHLKEVSMYVTFIISFLSMNILMREN